MNAKYFNRELSWIEFNARVLNEGCRSDVPLLERLKFLSITANNFDEFFQVRVAAIKRLASSSPRLCDASGFTPPKLLKKISERCHQLLAKIDSTLTNEILPQLSENGFEYVCGQNFTQSQKSYAETLFRHEIFPLLTPLRTDGDSFPNISNLRLTAAFLLEPLEGVHLMQSALVTKNTGNIVALVQIPTAVSSVVWLPSGDSDDKKYFTLLDDIIAMYGTKLFSGYNVKESLIFKVARDADFAVNEKSGTDFIQAMEEVLIKRQSSFAVRMVCTDTSAFLKKFISEKLNLGDDDIYEVHGHLNSNALADLKDITFEKELLFPEWQNFQCDMLPKEGTYWNTLRQRDVLLNVPYQSFDPVVKFIQDAAEDKNVLAIKMTLYRTGSESPIVKALKQAAQNGKQVTAFVELKARFDEKRNISWAAQLEDAGVIVVYGVVNLKVHAKACLVVRRESDGIRRYAHLSTGNYNTKTAREYQDFSIFTSKSEIVNDATLFFNVISGYSALQTMHNLYMAPVTLKTRLLELIEREVSHVKSGSGGLIVAKMNSLCHKEIIDALYRAASSGVKIMLNVRGICTLVPQVAGLSENISVVSIVDRYLEHSRVFYFANGGHEELYLSSADWMERNLDRRIELMFPVTDGEVFAQLKEFLMFYFDDNTHAWRLQKDGTWKEKAPVKKEEPLRVQEVLYKKYKKRDDLAKSQPVMDFVVRRTD